MSKHIVKLDRERELAFTNLARYRMGTLERPFGLEDLTHRHRSYAALVAWVWACLVDDEGLPTPEAVAPHLPMERVTEAVTVLAAAVKQANDDSEKNAGGSTRRPSPSSS